VARFDTVLLRLPRDAGETHEKFRSQGICFPTKMDRPEVFGFVCRRSSCDTSNVFVPRTPLLFHLTSDYHDKYSSEC